MQRTPRGPKPGGGPVVQGKMRRPTREELKARMAALEEELLPRVEVSDKVAVQAEMSYMRTRLGQGLHHIDVTYPVNPPYAFIQVRFDPSQGALQYLTREPALDRKERELLATIRDRLEAVTSHESLPATASQRLRDAPEVRAYIRERFQYVLDLYNIDIPRDRIEPMFYYLHRDLVGYGRADAVLRDPFVEDVSCNGHGVPMYVFHRIFGSLRTNVIYPDERDLNRYILMLAQTAGKHVSVYQPILDATMDDGSRINLTLGTEVTKKGSTFSIRKFSQDPISPIDLMRLGSLSAEQLAYFWTLIESKRSILVSGGTASGKTTLLNAISMFIRPEDKVVTIEDTSEVHLEHQNWIQSVSRSGFGAGREDQSGAISLFDLLVAALRQRPEFIIVGEVRGREAFTMFQAISTGHAAMATIHAADIDELLNRVENEPMNIPRALFQSLDAVVFPGQVRLRGQRARRVRGVTEILHVDPGTGNLLTNEVFSWDPASDMFRFSGRSYVLEDIARSTGRPIEAVEGELKRKARYLQALERNGMSHFNEAFRAVTEYGLDPEAALAGVEGAR